MDEHEQERKDRLEEEQAAVLPAREAISLITPHTASPFPDPDAAPADPQHEGHDPQPPD